MSFVSSISPYNIWATRVRLQPAQCLGLIIGLVMPLLSAWLYPIYFYSMPTPFGEWTRLQEIPFVICEIVFVVWTIMRGMELRQFTRVLPRDCLVALAIFFAGLWTSSLMVSQVPITSITISFTFLMHLLFACSVCFLLKDAGSEVIDDFVLGLTLGLVALAIVTALKFLIHPAPSTLFSGEIIWQASLPGFINVRHFGSWTGAIAAIFAAVLLSRENHKTTSWHGLAYVLSAGMTIWSGTRAAILAISFACLIMIVSRRRIPSLGTIGRLCILTGTAATLAYLALPPGEGVFKLVTAARRYGTVDEATSLRGTLWSLTYAEWLKAPWFGWGSGATFWQVPFPNWHHTQPHNFVLQFLVSWGVVGASGALWLLGRAIVAAHRGTMTRPETWPLLVGLYTLIIMAGLEGMLHYPRFIMLIMILFAMIFTLTKRPLQNRHLPEASVLS